MIKLILLITGLGAVTMYVVNERRQQPESVLVRYLASAGAGDVREVSDEALHFWFRDHASAAKSVAGECRTMPHGQQAAWHDGPDARICGVVWDSLPFEPPPADTKGY